MEQSLSTYAEKLMAGIVPSMDDWREHLLWAHRRYPNGTGKNHGKEYLYEGQTTYELLAESLDAPSVGADPIVVDLACGGGYLIQFLLPKLGRQGKLIGVDFSESELSFARQKYHADSKVEFHCANANALPVDAGSADAVLCHLGIMLMLPVEPVIAEVARVLKSGGVFSAVIGARDSRRIGVYGEAFELAMKLAYARYPALREVRTGDWRLFSDEGIRQLFRPDLGFHEHSKLKDISVRYRMDVQAVWAVIRNTYSISWIPDSEKEEIGREVKALLSGHADSDGRVVTEIAYKIFSVTKA